MSSSKRRSEDAMSKKPLVALGATAPQGEALSKRQRFTVRSPNRESMDPGSTASLDLDKDHEQISLSSDGESCAVTPLANLRGMNRASSSGTGGGSQLYEQLRKVPRGGKYVRSTSTVNLESGSPPLSTTRSDTREFTLWQASNLYGSTGTKASAFSSLMSMRAALSRKRSMASWMDILTEVQSKADLSTLAGLLSSSARTKTTTRTSQRRLYAGSSQVASSSSEDDEVSTQHLPPSSQAHNPLLDSQTSGESTDDVGSSDQD